MSRLLCPGTNYLRGWFGPKTGLNEVRRQFFTLLGLEPSYVGHPAPNTPPGFHFMRVVMMKCISVVTWRIAIETLKEFIKKLK
jgi:hypothetical protein